ncbi:helix-turn-helix domain-containing protein [Umezawaea sp. Da 62-37]|uniref:GbsR/MarR family transcriptional regulator n=1 Tax=Umezawaea sp. Da 62-37 TaxID=3075927 RepID=UPI0028F6D9AE|nr:helix-turn-helix domain-containing protein [Umezawaea sp. Da 62-37]WNV89862.1 helix-turn-helix domain-containing protein [Umezawaea sp. Da 62-37]
MPGGRLTDEDRGTVAAGLAEGLGYAEIARGLGRPTSTISREVARNGGPAGYRAEYARAATSHRAKRRRPVPDPVQGTSGAVRDFVERFAGLMVRTGLPRMSARVFASLITTDSGALTAVELVRGLGVSPASVSKAVGYLEGLELVRRDSSGRRERYFIDDDVWLHTWLTSARTNAMWAEASEQGARVVGPGTPAGARLDSMRGFFAQLGDDMSGGPSAAAANDALTVVAALVHAGGVRSVGELAGGLGWEAERVVRALGDADLHPGLADPVAVRRVGSDGYAVGAAAGRLSAAQREALGG